MLFLCCTTYLFFQIFFLCWIYVVQHIRFSKFFSYVGFMLYNIFVFPIFFLIFVKKMLYNIWGFFRFDTTFEFWISKRWRGGSGGRNIVGGWCKIFSIKPNYDNKLFGDLRKLNILCTKIVPMYNRVDNLCSILRKSTKQFHVMFWVNWQKSYVL